MAYDRINWENAPSTETPLSAENLNTMDNALANIDERVSATAEAIESVQRDVSFLDARIDTIVSRPEGATGIYNVVDGTATGSARTIGAVDAGDNALGDYAWAEGNGTKATGQGAHAEGYNTQAIGNQSHAEGSGSISSGTCSHAEGAGNASGNWSHAEGGSTKALAHYAHAEGNETKASGYYGSHAEGFMTEASGDSSHAEGTYTKATHKSQHVFGAYNKEDPNSSGSGSRGTYIEIVGNGNANNNRSNARTLDWEGNEVLAGDLVINGNRPVGYELTELQSDLAGYACWITDDILEVTQDDLESGTWRYSEKLPDTKILRYNKLIPVRKGMTFRCINPTYTVIYALLETKTSASALQLVTTNAGVNRTATIGYDGYMALIISSASDISVSDYDCEISITKKSTVIVDDSLTIAGKAADAKATGDALDDLREYVDAETSIGTKTELIPNVSTTFSSYSGTTNTEWYLSDRTIPEGSIIKRVKIGSRENYNYGAVIFINNNNVVVYKKVDACTANEWNTFDINLQATEDLRIAVSAKAAFTTTNVSDDAAIATNGLWKSSASPVVGSAITFTQASPYNFMISVQWEVETPGDKISNVVDEQDTAIKGLQSDVNYLKDDMDDLVDNSLAVAGKAADAKATGDALYDLEETIHTETSIKTKTEFIPNISYTLSSYTSSANSDWYLSNRVIPEGSVIKSVRIGAKTDVNSGSIIFINDDDVVVRKYTVSCSANEWNTVELNLLANENLRLAVSASVAFTTIDVSDDAAIATDGLRKSEQGSINVGDTLTYSKVGPYLYMFAVQWEVETYGKISDSIITVKDKRPDSGYHNFSVSVNYHDFTDNAADGETLYPDYGVVALPTNYSATGTPTKLIILCGGAGERIASDTNPLSFHGWAYYLAKGYAVMDMNGISAAWATAMGFPRTSWHYCNKYLIDSYHKGYEYVLNKYNIDRTKVFIAGISMGGGASALLVQSGIFPVVAHCGFCPALSVYKQDYMNAWHGDTQQKTIAGMYGFANWSSTTTFDQAYFLTNISKISGFENLTIRAIGDIDTANAHYGDADEAAAYNSMQKIYPVPVKIWHSVDDPTVLVRYSEFFVNMIKNGGGQAWLRTFPSGAHVGGWSYGSVSDTDIDGNAITTSIPFYESILFFKRFG